MICPSHGIMWKKHIPEILEKYVKWSGNITDEKAVIVFDTMWGSTKEIAYAIYNGFESKGIKATLMNLNTNHISNIMAEVLEAKYIVVGSPTLNNGMLPTVSAFLTYLKGLAPKNRFGLAFGSYGWGGQSISQIQDMFVSSGYKSFMEPIKLQYVPGKEDLEKITREVGSATGNIAP